MQGPRSGYFAGRLPPGPARKPKSPGDFSIDNVGVRRGECRDEVGRGHGLEWPVRELRRWPLVAAQGVAASGIVRRS